MYDDYYVDFSTNSGINASKEIRNMNGNLYFVQFFITFHTIYQNYRKKYIRSCIFVNLGLAYFDFNTKLCTV